MKGYSFNCGKVTYHDRDERAFLKLKFKFIYNLIKLAYLHSIVLVSHRDHEHNLSVQSRLVLIMWLTQHFHVFNTQAINFQIFLITF